MNSSQIILLPTKSTSKLLILKSIVHVIQCIFIIYLIRNNVLHLLHQNAIEMERWEPTEIISTPFPIEVLRLFVYNVVISIMILSTSIHIIIHKCAISSSSTSTSTITPYTSTSTSTFQTIIHYCIMMIVLYILSLFIIILSGVSITNHIIYSLYANLYFTFLTFGYFQPPPPASASSSTFGEQHQVQQPNREQQKKVAVNGIGSSKSSSSSSWTVISYYSNQLLIYLFLGKHNTNNTNINIIIDDDNNDEYVNNNDEYDNTNIFVFFEEIVNRYILYTTILVTIPFQILNILDHGDQFQRWPMPIIIGATVGHCFGTLIGLMRAFWKLIQWWNTGTCNGQRKIRKN